MKKSIQIIATVVGLLFGNAAFSQVDSVYIVKGDSVLAVYATTEVDSVIFYRPNPINTTNNTIIADADGNVYTSVTIGTQEWMTENLRTTKYSDGTAIPNVKDDTQWSNLITGAWSHYRNDNENGTTYGNLYNWYAVKSNKLCPTGWHVPTDAEWTVLNDYLAADGHVGTEGTVLKATSGWNDDANGTDNYGWLGLPGASRFSAGSFINIGYYGYWWSSSETNSSSAWIYSLGVNYEVLGRGSSSNKSGMSVRCLKD